VNRIDRLHAILTHLQSKKKVTAQQLANRFSISLRTVYRDMKALEESGVPVIGEAGSGYSIMEGYRLPPLMFTQEEAAALVVGSTLAQQMTDASVQQQYENALYKIKAVLRSTDKDYIEQLMPNIAVSVRQPVADEFTNSYLAPLQNAAANKKTVFLQYLAGTEQITERTVEPIGLWYYSNNWHLIGWCRLRNGYRDFRVNRIQHLQVKDEVFSPRSYESLHDYISELRTNAPQLIEATVLFSKEVIPFITNLKYQYGFMKQEEAGNNIRMTFVNAYPEVFGRWLLSFTNAATVESPAILQMIMEELAEELANHYSKKL
jgi:predicted DNA-binding transcriptional regulator YafY